MTAVRMGAMCPVCDAAVNLNSNKFVRHARRGEYTLSMRCEGSGAVATTEQRQAWIERQRARVSDGIAAQERHRARLADDLRASEARSMELAKELEMLDRAAKKAGFA